MAIVVEVAVSEGVSSTARGELLEELAKQALESIQYEVVDRVRLTGMEVDLLARHTVTDARVYIECKAHRDALAADVITKLLGNVTLRDVTSGWLITTAPLGKDAKGLQADWEARPANRKSRLAFYTPERLVDLLIRSRRVVDHCTLLLPMDSTASEDLYLLLTNHGRFWAVPVVNVAAGVPFGVFLFDAVSGQRCTSETILHAVAETDTSLRTLKWLGAEESQDAEASQALSDEAQSIVTVTSGLDWTDYRPARPRDFVGRSDLQDGVLSLLEAVRAGQTTSRLFAIKSPSGWGKSSAVLKIAAQCGNVRNRNRFFVFPVDSRAASSPRYAVLALLAALRAAINAGFVSGEADALRIGVASRPFSDAAVAGILAQLRGQSKVIVLVFDQFEEIFAKKELAPLFESIRVLCSSVDGAQENFVIGFAWKTDGTIPQDHPAYYMWHSLADRRREFTLTPFSRSEVNSALARFQDQLGTSLNPILKRHLAVHCQGYPWLLKKLCLHVYELVKGGSDQLEILGIELNVKELFERDMRELTPAEGSCLRMIAQESPAEFFKLAELYGGDTVQSLVNRRLVLHSGSRLTLYWDIFRDYVLSGTVPNIPITYIPTTGFPKFCAALRSILTARTLSVPELARALNAVDGTAENIARDLAMVGSAQAHAGRFTVLQSTESEAARAVRSFLRSHVVGRHFAREKGPTFSTNVEEMLQAIKGLYPAAKYSDATWRLYVLRLLDWLMSIGLMKKVGAAYYYAGDDAPVSLPAEGGIRRIRIAFIGQAPPDRVTDVVRLIRGGVAEVKLLHERKHRNSLAVLAGLRAAAVRGGRVQLVDLTGTPEHLVRAKLDQSEIFAATAAFAKSRAPVTADQIGGFVSGYLQARWTPSSRKRYGNGMLQWLRWAGVLADG